MPGAWRIVIKVENRWIASPAFFSTDCGILVEGIPHDDYRIEYWLGDLFCWGE